jgi:hypothetical protein
MKKGKKKKEKKITMTEKALVISVTYFTISLFSDNP